MRIIVSRDHLFAHLRTISRIIKSGPKHEYQSFMFDITENKLTVTGCDESGQISTPVDCTIEDGKDLRFLLDSSILLNALKEVPEQPITFEVGGKEAGAKITIDYQNGKFEMIGGDEGLFPAFKEQFETKEIKLHSSTLRNGLRMMRFATDDYLRPAMNNVNLSSKNGDLAFAASTGHDLGVYEEDTEIDDFEVNIPVKIAKIVSDMLVNVDEDIPITFDKVSIKFQIKDYVITYRLFEGKFPNYRAVIPSHSDIIVTIDREEFISAINRVSVFADGSTMLLKLELSNNNIIITSESLHDQRNAKEDIFLDAVYPELTIGFKGDYLARILKTIETEKCEIHLMSPDRAAVFKPVNGDRLTLLLMPMIINQ